MKDFRGRLAVLSGAGSGMGRALALQLAGEGCHLGLCDINADALAETAARCRSENSSVQLTTAACDVAEEAELQDFRQKLESEQPETELALLINNAGVSGGGSFVLDSRAEWERTFAICWSGVYLMTRTFLPALLKAEEGHVVNMSSALGLRAVLGGHVPHTAYSVAKFAVRGFSEALIHDFRFNAPHLKVSMVLPGTIGTGIMSNSLAVLGHNQPTDWTTEEVAAARRRWDIAGSIDHSTMDDDAVRAAGVREIEAMSGAGISAEEAAEIILDGVRNDRWRILVGPDVESLDACVNEAPEAAYDPDFVLRWREANAALMAEREG
ncbi:MAG: SDR family NAD(P)-dependent oxidoreductase [Pseudomonadota bacterium]